jgi:GH25 family lysozyme M1 (1,4-beta-N-acetylmuramidase)
MNKQLIPLFAATALALTACAPAGKTTDALAQSSTSGSNDSNGETPPVETSPPTSDMGNEMAPPPADPFPVDSRTYSSPWSRSDTQIVIDAYSGNSIDWNKMATDKRVSGVIHRASIGLTVDSQYKAREKAAKQRGYLWGAYHLGKSGDPIAQAKLFLQTLGGAQDTLMFLDLEDTSSSNMMNIPNAKKFLDYVYHQTGKMPVVYANGSVTLALTAAMKSDPTFAKTRLWYARFKSTITDFNGKLLWPSYFLWQFSSEINCSKTGSCLYNVPGTSFDMDVNVFYGDRKALAYEWSL